jgi:selenocysteine lyase/cysteine desulfurase
MSPGLIGKNEFLGLESVAHLAAGGETPAMLANIAAVDRYYNDKGTGMPGRVRMFETVDKAKKRLARLLSVTPDEIALLWNATAGLHILAAGLDLRPGDNVVAGAAEFISLLTVWHNSAAELRWVGDRRHATIDEIASAVDDRTRAILVSHVSYLTGARSDLAALREIADRHGARLIVDASHSLGVVPVDGSLCDALVSCCYKWMFGTHGVGVFFVDARRWPDLAPTAIGWNSLVSEEAWRSRVRFDLKPGMAKFEGGNLTFNSIYFLESGLSRLEQAGVGAIEAYILDLGRELHAGLTRLNLDILTPQAPGQRAGNICFATEKCEALEAHLRANGIITWGDDNRLRLSLHAYNDTTDVERALTELKRALG